MSIVAYLKVYSMGHARPPVKHMCSGILRQGPYVIPAYRSPRPLPAPAAFSTVRQTMG